MATETFWDHVRVDRAFHTSLAITKKWPRLDVPAELDRAAAPGRHSDPVGHRGSRTDPTVSQRRVNRDSTRPADAGRGTGRDSGSELGTDTP